MKLLIRVAAAVAASLITVFSATAAVAVGTLDQHAEPSFVNAAFAQQNSKLAQTFTPSVSGTLDQVMLRLAKNGSPGTLNIDIFETAGGMPTGSSLASATFSDSTSGLSGSYTNFDIVFTSPASLVAGMKYAIVLDAPSALTTMIMNPNYNPMNPFMGGPQYSFVYNYYMWSYGADQAQNGNRLDNGSVSWNATANQDYYFATYMTEVSPPTSSTTAASQTAAPSTSEDAELANTGAMSSDWVLPEVLLGTLFGLAVVLGGVQLRRSVSHSRVD